MSVMALITASLRSLTFQWIQRSLRLRRPSDWRPPAIRFLAVGCGWMPWFSGHRGCEMPQFRSSWTKCPS